MGSEITSNYTERYWSLDQVQLTTTSGPTTESTANTATLNDWVQSWSSTGATATHDQNATTVDFFDILLSEEGEAKTCWRPYFGTNTEHYEVFMKNYSYYYLVPSAIIIISLSLVNARKFLCLSLFNGRPSVPVPLNLIENRDDRFSLVVGFCFTTWTLLGVIFGTMPFEWDYPSSIKSLMLMLSSILLGLLFYPIFGTFSAKNLIVYILGTLYMWLQYFVFLITTWPCIVDNNAVIWTLYWFSVLPIHFFFAILGLSMPWKAIQICLKRKKGTGNYLIDNKELYQVHHVMNLLEKNKTRGLPDELRIKNILKSSFYWPVPGFRYSVSILTGISVGVLMVYILALQSFIAYFQISAYLEGILDNLLSPEPNSMKEAFYQLLPLDPAEINPILEDIRFWKNAIVASIYVSIIGSVFLTVGSLLLSLRNYRKHLLYLYRGIYKGIPKKTGASPRSIVVQSTKFIGFQFGYSAWGYIFQAFALLLISVVVTVFVVLVVKYGFTEIIIQLLKDSGPIVAYLVLLVLFQNLIVHFIFLLKGTNDRRVLGIDNRRLFFNFQYFMIYANAPLGFFSCLLRILKGVIFGLVTITRLDVSTLSRTFEPLDNGFSAYVAMVKMENAMTNPVMLVFINLLIESIKNQPSCTEKSLAKWNQNLRISKSGKVPSMHCDLAHSKMIRNRWHLFITLHNNISLRLLRVHAPVMEAVPIYQTPTDSSEGSLSNIHGEIFPSIKFMQAFPEENQNLSLEGNRGSSVAYVPMLDRTDDYEGYTNFALESRKTNSTSAQENVTNIIVESL